MKKIIALVAALVLTLSLTAALADTIKIGVPGGVFHLVGAVRAVHFDPIGLLHGDRLFSALRLNNHLIV